MKLQLVPATVLFIGCILAPSGCSTVGGRRGQSSAASDSDTFGVRKPWSWRNRPI